MPTIEIPDIQIREIYIPDVPEIYSPHYITITAPPEIDAPGCTCLLYTSDAADE